MTVNMNTASKTTDSLLKSRLLALLASVVSLAAGIATVSVPLLLLSGIFAYGWPLLHAGYTKLREVPTAKPGYKAGKPAHAVR